MLPLRTVSSVRGVKDCPVSLCCRQPRCAPRYSGADTAVVVISKRVAWFLVAFGVWSWIIWPTFLKNIWADKRSWNDGMTAFFGVHLVLTVVSLALGTIIGVLGVRAVRARPAAGAVDADRSVTGLRL